jgi:cyclic beta-1,2-glucan synthetase
MALMVSPVEACENLQRLAAEGRAGAYGFHEAVDYTPARLPPDETSATIQVLHGASSRHEPARAG